MTIRVALVRFACVVGATLLWSDLPVLGDDDRQLTAITEVPTVISKAGRYELAGDLTLALDTGAAITVAADDVTVDLGGHTLRGTTGSDTRAIGVRAVDRQRVQITNGTVTGFYFGIDIQSDDRVDSRSTGHQISQVTLDANWYFGIRLVGSDSTIEACHITSTGGSTLPRHTIPHGVRLTGERNVLRDCCINDLHLQRFDEGRGEIVGVHFDAARESRMEGNTIIEHTTDADDVFPVGEQQERRFAVWINGGPHRDTHLTVKNNRIAGFTVPLAFTPGTDGLVEGNTFAGATATPIRGKPSSQLSENVLEAGPLAIECATSE